MRKELKYDELLQFFLISVPDSTYDSDQFCSFVNLVNFLDERLLKEMVPNTILALHKCVKCFAPVEVL